MLRLTSNTPRGLPAREPRLWTGGVKVVLITVKPQVTKHLVFVYGTLRSGNASAMSVRFPEAKLVAAATVSGSLYDLGPYPGLLLGESNALVVGEVYEVDDETLNELDEFEAPSFYRRKGVEISVGSDSRTGWTYEPDPESYSLGTLIPSGDWIEYAATTEASGSES